MKIYVILCVTVSVQKMPSEGGQRFIQIEIGVVATQLHNTHTQHHEQIFFPFSENKINKQVQLTLDISSMSCFRFQLLFFQCDKKNLETRQFFRLFLIKQNLVYRLRPFCTNHEVRMKTDRRTQRQCMTDTSLPISFDSF